MANTITMRLLIQVLMLAGSFTAAFPASDFTNPQFSEVERPDRALMQVLRDLASLSTEQPLPVLLLNPSHMGVSSPLIEVVPPRGKWDWYLDKTNSQNKKLQNLSSYNLNSFGLRYGK
ncbi:metastasis-suppressor KiSS-1 isoform X2 [Osmerus eperlanus]